MTPGIFSSRRKRRDALLPVSRPVIATSVVDMGNLSCGRYPENSPK
jgi:hypothetical protein